VLLAQELGHQYQLALEQVILQLQHEVLDQYQNDHEVLEQKL
jgi:hypothetical protein